MIISTFGTRICDAAIKYSKNTIENVNRLVEISPFTVAEKYSPDKKSVSDIKAVKCKNDYWLKIFEKEYNNEITEILGRDCAGLVVIDCSVCRLAFMEYTFDNGQVFRITVSAVVKNNYEKLRDMLCNDYQAKIVSERVLNPMSMEPDELETNIREYAEWLNKEIGANRIILLSVRHSYQYLSKNNRIGILDSEEIKKVNTYNVFNSRCEEILLKYIKCPVIKALPNIVIDGRTKEPDIFEYTKLYYEYINECINVINAGDYNENSEIIFRAYGIKMKAQTEEIRLRILADFCHARGKGRKLIIIGGSAIFEADAQKRYGLDIVKKVVYTCESTMQDIIEQMQDFIDKSDDYICAIPYLFPKAFVSEALWRCGYSNVFCVTPYHEQFHLRSFVGEYTDFYNNRIVTKIPINVDIIGSGNCLSIGDGKVDDVPLFRLLGSSTVEIGEGVNIEKGFTMAAYDGSRLTVGKNAVLGSKAHIRNSFFNKIVLGDNVSVGDSTVLFCGDGHAIIDVKTGNNINYNLNISAPSKHEIIVGDNVLLGDGAFILSGSVVGNNSIVRERALVNKKFGENCYIAGQPARELDKEEL